MTDVDIVMVHYHAAECVREAATALRADAAKSEMQIDLIVIDNGSTQQERELLRSLDALYVDAGRNVGYAGAVKIAFPLTRADSIVMMNEDVLVLPGCLPSLNAELRNGAAIVGPEFYWDRDCVLRLPCTEERTRENELLKAGGRRSAATLARARSRWRGHARRHWRSTIPMRTTSLSGALLAFRRDTWSMIGPLDDAFPLYFEENDWLLRAAAAGLPTLLVPTARAIHLHNPFTANSPARQKMYEESFSLFAIRHYGEGFLRRLRRLSSGDCVAPEWPLLHGRVVPIVADSTRLPLWLEVTPSPCGFPAATMVIPNDVRDLALPRMGDLEFLDGILYLQIVDDDGLELHRWSFTASEILRGLTGRSPAATPRPASSPGSSATSQMRCRRKAMDSCTDERE